jgi:hypothetical protein
VWADAAKWLAKFDEAVLTGLDADGYPVSIRANSRTYDATTGRLPVSPPSALHIAEGPANLLRHSHDEKLWHLNAIQIKGRLENRDDEWSSRAPISTLRRNWCSFNSSQVHARPARSTWTSEDCSVHRSIGLLSTRFGVGVQRGGQVEGEPYSPCRFDGPATHAILRVSWG